MNRQNKYFQRQKELGIKYQAFMVPVIDIPKIKQNISILRREYRKSLESDIKQ